MLLPIKDIYLMFTAKVSPTFNKEKDREIEDHMVDNKTLNL
jgi:hypothetical protein